MTDLAHFYGQGLSVGPTGDLALASGDAAVQQRLVRRLLTALGDYIQHTGYGAGLGALVGQPTNIGAITGVVRRQMKKEASISQNPAPTVTVGSALNTVTLNIGYVDIFGKSQTLTVPVS